MPDSDAAIPAQSMAEGSRALQYAQRRGSECGACSATPVNQQSTINTQHSTINNPQSTINN
jgi:hypothetical protein